MAGWMDSIFLWNFYFIFTFRRFYYFWCNGQFILTMTATFKGVKHCIGTALMFSLREAKNCSGCKVLSSVSKLSESSCVCWLEFINLAVMDPYDQ